MSDTSILGAIQKLLSLLSRREKWQLVKMMSFAFCTSLLEMVTASTIVILAQIINYPDKGLKYLTLFGSNANLTSSKIIFYFALLVGLTYFVKNSFAIVETFYQHFSIQRMNYRFKKKLLARYAQADYSLFLQRNSTQSYAIISSDADLTFSSALVSLTIIFSETIIFLSLVSMIIYLQPALALWIFALGGLLSLVMVKLLFPLFYQWGKKHQEFALLGEKNLFQFFHAFKEIILMNKRESFINAYYFYARKRSKIQAKQNVTNILPRMVTELLFIFLFVSVIGYCLHTMPPSQMVGILGAYLYVGFRLIPGLNRIIMQLNTFKSIIPCINRVAEEYHQGTQKENLVDCPSFQFNHTIELRNVNFCYQRTTNPTLKNVSLTIKKGECIGIIGETGSGKSTLADLILGLLKPQSGTILIDGKYPVNSAQWHSLIGYVQQSFYLIDDTIQANIVFGEDASDLNLLRLQNALQDAQLQSFIAQLSEGLMTIVGERGLRLSGGEKQRIAIARALYHNPSVFIFDEATSALDTDTEMRLMETIDSIHKNQRTIIIIAHRLSTLKSCDRIIMMKDGTIDQILSYHALARSRNL